MGETRVVKRYANRKLYDTQRSRYVTLEQIAEMIRGGEDVKIVDNNSKDDLTEIERLQPGTMQGAPAEEVSQTGEKIAEKLPDFSQRLAEIGQGMTNVAGYIRRLLAIRARQSDADYKQE